MKPSMSKKKKSSTRTSKSDDKRLELEYNEVGTAFENSFISSLNSKKIMAIKCRGCRKIIFPPSEFCPFCGRKNSKSDFLKVSNDGKVFSQTLVHYPASVLPDIRPPFSIIAFRLSQTDTFVIVPSKNTSIYLGDRVKAFIKQKDRKNNMSDIELEKL